MGCKFLPATFAIPDAHGYALERWFFAKRADLFYPLLFLDGCELVPYAFPVSCPESSG